MADRRFAINTIQKGEDQMSHPKTTSAKVASKASKILRNPHASKAAKSAAGSALSQKHRK